MTVRDYAWNVQPQSITVHFSNGDDFVWPNGHAHFAEARDAIKAGASGDELRKLMDTMNRVKTELGVAVTSGLIEVNRDGVFYNGTPIHMTVTDRIMAFMAEGFPVDPLIKFLEKLLTNARREAVLSLYDFLEANRIPITEDGDFLVYKRVRGDYKDIHSGTFDNSVGQKPRVMAWEVEADRDQTCAKGLHVCARQYLPSFGAGEGNRVVICKVNPADVVAVPRDYNNSKMRVCGYEVIGELNDAQKAEIFDNAKLVKPGDFDGDVTWGDNFKETGEEWADYNDGFVEDTCYDCGNDENYCECGATEEECEFPECPSGEELASAPEETAAATQTPTELPGWRTRFFGK